MKEVSIDQSGACSYSRRPPPLLDAACPRRVIDGIAQVVVLTSVMCDDCLGLERRILLGRPEERLRSCALLRVDLLLLRFPQTGNDKLFAAAWALMSS